MAAGLDMNIAQDEASASPRCGVAARRATEHGPGATGPAEGFVLAST